MSTTSNVFFHAYDQRRSGARRQLWRGNHQDCKSAKVSVWDDHIHVQAFYEGTIARIKGPKLVGL